MDIFKKYNLIYILAPILIVLSVVVYVLYPREVQHGIFIGNSQKYSSFLIEGRSSKLKTKPLDFDKYSVVNFKYNLLKAYGFKQIDPINDRVMVKGLNSYDLENQGFVALAKKTTFYQIDKNNNLVPVEGRNLIVGKNNVKSYKDRTGKLRTFILAPMDYSTMRVAISTTNFTSRFHDRMEFKTSGPARLFSNRESFSTDIADKTTIVIENRDNALAVKWGDNDKSFSKRLYLRGDGISISSISRGTPSFTPKYNGVLEITPSTDGLMVINEIGLEEYLSKVVPSEMPAGSAPEALKCQAVAARTYAISDMLANRFADFGFHVDDSTMSQVYNNIPPHPRSTEAVSATKGLIMTYNGEPIDAKYYSTSAGTGVTYKDIWFRSDGSSEDKPYFKTASYVTSGIGLPNNEADWLAFYKDKTLKAYDSASPYFRWQIEFPEADLTRSLNKSLKNLFEKRKEYMTVRQGDKTVNEFPELKKLQDIKTLKRSEGGNILQLSFIFENAVVDVSNDSLIRSSIKCSKEFTEASIPITRISGPPIMNSTSLPSSFFSVEKINDKFMFYGGGYGHGVGMSQYGAMELGKSGMDYKSILNTFYKDVTLEKIY